MKKLLNLFVALLFAIPAFAQEEVEMADKMRSEGKIYVLVAIIFVILAGLLAYLFMIERKTARLEKRLNENKPS